MVYQRYNPDIQARKFYFPDYLTEKGQNLDVPAMIFSHVKFTTLKDDYKVVGIFAFDDMGKLSTHIHIWTRSPSEINLWARRELSSEIQDFFVAEKFSRFYLLPVGRVWSRIDLRYPHLET